MDLYICLVKTISNIMPYEFHEFLGHPFTDLSILEKALIAPGAKGDRGGNQE